MKKPLYILGLSILLLASCKDKEAPLVDYVILKGNITNTNSNKILLTKELSTYADTLIVTANGAFLDTIKVPIGEYSFMVDNNKIKLYLEKEFNLKINADAKDFDNTISIVGKGELENNYLKFKKEQNSSFKVDADLLKLEENSFKEKINNHKTTLNNKLDKTEGLSYKFKAFQKKDNNYNYLLALSSYKNMHTRYVENKEFKLSKESLQELEQVTYYSDEDYKNHDGYKTLAILKLRNEIIKESKNSKYPVLAVAAKLQSEFIKNELLLQVKYVITHKVDMHQNSEPNFNMDEYYAKFKSIATDKELITQIEKQYKNLKLLDKGNPSPKFVDYENHAGGKTSLEDLKGKYVYIDVWATWCIPCIAEIPALKETEKAFHGKNIEFVSISLDSHNHYEKWKQMVVDKELGGIQLIADKEFDSDFMQDYVIRGIPHFILIDTEGNIVNAHAPRPSDPKLKEVLNSLL
ncbi:TlpA family protein disulfide reductase [Cellulophaga sp. 20_2_10]|uniref:TlpA family protein disulfide reductase n=1 Tax=Cellulophaga sp. 20_2_10 TaxID=2942476 RepID=UPI00201A2851|nr:TlpA disulfide reductase family protein [Cellulophaga sp. 20_2_10]MCL5244835.1 TlpA family protein disulfide reductase [Cellulophaga sp. 20_2_10]